MGNNIHQVGPLKEVNNHLQGRSGSGSPTRKRTLPQVNNTTSGGAITKPTRNKHGKKLGV